MHSMDELVDGHVRDGHTSLSMMGGPCKVEPPHTTHAPTQTAPGS